MKTLYYCFGGGLGHLTRFIAWCHTTRTQPVLLTNCPQAATPGLLPAGVRCVMPGVANQKNRGELQSWIRHIINIERPQQLIIDAFPGGILGELADLVELANIACVYLARILKLEQYLPRLANADLPNFSSIVRLEKLSDAHEDFLKKISDNITSIELVDPPFKPDAGFAQALPDNFDLIIHAGNHDEIMQLYRMALETAELEKRTPVIVLISTAERPLTLPKTVTQLSCYPAAWALARAHRVFSGAGFNIMRQMAKSRAKHAVLPFARALDDQFFRAACQQKP